FVSLLSPRLTALQVGVGFFEIAPLRVSRYVIDWYQPVEKRIVALNAVLAGVDVDLSLFAFFLHVSVLVEFPVVKRPIQPAVVWIEASLEQSRIDVLVNDSIELDGNDRLFGLIFMPIGIRHVANVRLNP